MTAFVTLGGVGLALVLVSLLLGELVDGALGLLHVDVDGFDGFLSGPVIGGFLAAFGFGAALVTGATAAGPGLGAVAGLCSGIAVGGAAGVFTRAVMRMPTDRTPRSSDLIGVFATVVTPIRPAAYGEITLRAGGQFRKLAARADEPVPAGASVYVVEALSATSVVVRPIPPARA